VVVKVSTTGIEISLTIIFTVGQKVQNLASPTFENAARYPNSERKVQCCDDRPKSSPSLVKLGQCTPETPLVSCARPLKSHGENVLNRQ